MTRTKKRISFLLIIALALSLLCACREKLEEIKLAEGDGQSANLNVHIITASDFGAQALLDAVRTDSGYLVMTGLDAFNTERELITLDDALNVLNRRSAGAKTDAFVTAVDGAGRLMTTGEAALTDTFSVGLSLRAYEAEGALYIYSADGLTRNDVEIALPEEQDKITYIRGLVTIGGVTYAVLEQKNTRTTPYTWKSTWLSPVAADTKELSDGGKSLPFDVSVCASNGEIGWMISGGTLYRTDGIEITPYADLAATGVNTDQVRRLIVMQDGFMLLSPDELVLLTMETRSQPTTSEKQVIRMASLWSSNYSTVIAEFNRENDRYTVENTTYDSIAQLNLALANGEADIVVSSDYNTIWSYAEKGLLTNLDDAIPKLFDEGVLVPSVVDAMRLHGSCYFLAPSFNMASFMLPEVDNREFANIGEFIDFVDANYPYVKYDPVSSLFYILNTYGDIWLDLDQRAAHFNSDSFARVLEFCNRFPSQYDEALESLYENDPYPQFALSFSSIRQLSEAEKASGEVSYLPVTISNENSAGIYVSSYYYIGVVSGGIESGAEEFLSYLILSGPFGSVEASNCMPLAISRLKEYLDETSLGRPLYTDYQKEVIWEYLPLADHINGLGAELAQHVIQEEAKVYFNGDCTLEDAIQRIQSRVSLYLAELG